MKSIRWAVFFWFLFTAGTALAETPREPKPYLSAQRKLAINRSLLTKAEAQYTSLMREESSGASEDLVRKISDLRYKIQALKEDAARLQTEMPKNLRANEFLKDLEHRSSVNVERDKKISDRMTELFALHEKALGLVAERRYGQAARVYEDIIMTSPDDDEAYLLLGHCRLLNTEYDKARDAFMGAIHIDPANAAEVTRVYENILVENPQDDAAYAHLGFARWILGQKEEARQAFESSLQINPANAEARAAMAGMASQV